MRKRITVDTVGSALTLAEPALKGLAALILALKEPMGKRKLEQLRTEFAASFEGLQEVITLLDAALQATEQARVDQEQRIRLLELQLEYLQLPFWRRWTTPKPSMVNTDVPG